MKTLMLTLALIGFGAASALAAGWTTPKELEESAPAPDPSPIPDQWNEPPDSSSTGAPTTFGS